MIIISNSNIVYISKLREKNNSYKCSKLVGLDKVPSIKMQLEIFSKTINYALYRDGVSSDN